MNLHFKDIELLNKLNNSTLFTCVFGSKMYQIDDANSDTDYIHVYAPSLSERNTFYSSHHQLQYKDIIKNEDHVYVNIFAFLKNILNGDSTTFFEIINHESIKNSPLRFLWEMRHAFYNYKILRSYNGICRRDIRELPKQKSEEDKNKKLTHVLRGHIFSKMIMDKSFNPIISEELKAEIKTIKSITNWEERKKVAYKLKKEVEEYRKYISKLHDSDNFPLPTFMDVENQKLLDKYMNELINSDIWKERSNWFMDLNIFYEANENVEIKYE